MADILVFEEEDIGNSDDVGVGEDDCRLHMSLMDAGGEGIVGTSPEKDNSEVNSYESLTAVERLERCISEHKSNNKRAVAQAVVDTLRIVSRESPQDVTAVLQILSRLAEDSDAQLRTDMMVQIPQIALLCYEIAEQLAGVVEGHLLPLVIKTLTDIEELVRKTAQTALIMLMEQNLVTCEAIEEQVCPVVLMLAEMGTLPDYHPNAVMLMSKIAPLVGREKAMELFLDHFVALCSDPALFVRTVCASNMGDFCTLMGTEVTEHVLLPCFVLLCKDSMWGVRKECANVFLSVSCVVTLATRKKVLAPIFVDLLRDQSRWVKVAAFHSLGPFIWTFAPDSIRSQESHSPAMEPETPVSAHPQKKASRFLRILFGVGTIDPMEKYMNAPDPCSSDAYWDDGEESEKIDSQTAEPIMSSDANVNVSGEETRASDESAKAEAAEPENDYNTFLFWRLPLPDVGLDAGTAGVPDSEKCSPLEVTTSTVSTAVTPPTSPMSSGCQNVTPSNAEDHSTVDREKMDVSWCPTMQKIPTAGIEPSTENGVPKLPENTVDNKGEISEENPPIHVHSDRDSPSEIVFDEENERLDVAEPKQSTFMGSTARCTAEGLGSTRKVPVGQTSLVQDIVPQALIDHYISMSTPLQFSEEDPELAHHCAFNFPAVALTLGRENWPLLSGAYEVLAVDVKWKVRRTLASSIHELAVILGEDLATRYLVPVFNGFAKDLDEVRIGVVKHLADFLKLIGPAGRNECLPCLLNLIKTDNESNWRFRDELIRQLMQVTTLFSPKDVKRFLTRMGMALLFSRVAAVRHNAMLLLAEHIRYLSVDKKLTESVLVILAREFARSEHWMRRQSYVFLCEQLLVPRSQRESRMYRNGEDDEEEESAERGHYLSRNMMLNEWADERQDDMSWRTRIAPLLAQHVYPYLLDLSCDKVANVRLAVARVLGSFQATPTEQSYLHSYLEEAGESEGSDIKRVPALDIALAQLQKDTDRDVRYFASRNRMACSSDHKISTETVEEEVDVAIRL